ncbi:hypothetical protein BD769DRAFT_1662618 [Suillus cothurnatus]|nr:hypothetical protein BD769DRAFT_1662618 [Suillus cothurnatus]
MATQRPLHSRGGDTTHSTRGQGGGGTIVLNAIQQSDITTNYAATPAASPTTSTHASATPTTSSPVAATPTTATPSTTSSRVTFLDTHPGACHVLFNVLTKSCNPIMSEPKTSGSQKSHIWATIAQTIFAEDKEYKMYMPKTNTKQGQRNSAPPDPYDVGDVEIDLNNNVTDIFLLTQGTVNPTLPSTLFNDANDNMDSEQWDEVRDDNLELAEQGDNVMQIHIPNKHPYPSSSLPPTYTLYCAINPGIIHTPRPPSSLMSSSLSASSSCAHLRLSMSTSPSLSSSTRRPAASQTSSSLSKCAESDMQEVQDQVQSLADGMNYIYIAKAAALGYKITKAEIEHGEADAVHQHSQEAKTLELQLLKTQAKVQMEKEAALKLEIELLKLKGTATSV